METPLSERRCHCGCGDTIRQHQIAELEFQLQALDTVVLRATERYHRGDCLDPDLAQRQGAAYQNGRVLEQVMQQARQQRARLWEQLQTLR